MQGHNRRFKHLQMFGIFHLKCLGMIKTILMGKAEWKLLIFIKFDAKKQFFSGLAFKSRPLKAINSTQHIVLSIILKKVPGVNVCYIYISL